MLTTIIVNFIYQFVYLFGILILACFIIGLCEKAFYRLCGGHAHKTCIALGIVGTPLHESGHALMCLLFGHKISKIVFFQPNSDDGVLGYVQHSYNPRNIYQIIGTFFISIGPIILGTSVLVGLLYLLQQQTMLSIADGISNLSKNLGMSLEDMVSYYLDIVVLVFTSLFAFDAITTFTWWIFMAISVSISLHMGLSNADIKNGLKGLAFSVVILLIVDIILGVIGDVAMQPFNYGVCLISGWVFGLLAVSLVLAVSIVVITFLISKLAHLVRSRRRSY